MRVVPAIVVNHGCWFEVRIAEVARRKGGCLRPLVGDIGSSTVPRLKGRYLLVGYEATAQVVVIFWLVLYYPRLK